MNSTLDEPALSRVLESVTACLTPEVAERITKIKLDEATQARIRLLGDKCDEGRLTDTEAAEYRAYVEAMDLIGVLKTKARLVLAKQPAA